MDQFAKEENLKEYKTSTKSLFFQNWKVNCYFWRLGSWNNDLMSASVKTNHQQHQRAQDKPALSAPASPFAINYTSTGSSNSCFNDSNTTLPLRQPLQPASSSSSTSSTLCSSHSPAKHHKRAALLVLARQTKTSLKSYYSQGLNSGTVVGNSNWRSRQYEQQQQQQKHMSRQSLRVDTLGRLEMGWAQILGQRHRQRRGEGQNWGEISAIY